MRADKARNYRRCFRMDRAMYWRIRDDAANLGLSDSSYIFWMMLAMLENTAGYSAEALCADIAGSIPDAYTTEFARAVEKASDGASLDDVPW
jgi:hypothetical protein